MYIWLSRVEALRGDMSSSSSSLIADTSTYTPFLFPFLIAAFASPDSIGPCAWTWAGMYYASFASMSAISFPSIPQ